MDKPTTPSTWPNTTVLTPASRRALAQATCELFEANHRPNVSFALDAKTGQFISPHVYLAAAQYLERGPNG